MTKRHEFLRLSELGDTIVEVMFAIGIIAALLAGGYTVARASMISEQRAQERAIALQLVQSQIEALKNYSESATLPIYNFCMVVNSTSATAVAASNASCQVDASGNATTTEPFYRLSVTAPVDNVYTVQAVWDDVGGQGQDNLTMYYKVYAQQQ